MLVKSLESKMMMREGYGVILGPNSVWGQFSSDGLVIYTEEGLESSDNYSQYEYLAIEKLLGLILQVQDYTTEEIMNLLEENTLNHHPLPAFSIVNTQNGKKTKVGEISNGIISISSPFIFPGNSSVIPNLPKASITISLADGVTDPGSPDFTYLALIRQGNYFAFRVAYQSNLLQNFNVRIQSTDCGATVYNPSFSRACFSKLKDKMGVVHLSSLTDSICYGDIFDFRALGINVPLVSDGCAMSMFVNKSTFPEFMTVLKEIAYTAGILPEIANIFGWKNVVVIQRPEWAQNAYNVVVNQCSSLHINIVNNQSYYFSGTYTIDQVDAYGDLFSDIINSKCRVVIALVDPYSFGSILITLYDLGMRKGDLFFLQPYRISVTDIVVGYPGYGDKLVELFQRSLTVHTAEWIGNYGQTMKTQVEQAVHWSNFLGFSFDQTMLALHGLDYSIIKGDNLENFTAVNENIRKQKFVGVTGTVSIEPSSNSRSNFYLNIFSVLPASNSSEKGDEIVGNYSITGIQRFLFSKIIMPDGTTKIPSDMRINPIDCPFDYRLVQDSSNGKMIFLAIVAFFIILEIFLVIFQLRRWKLGKIEDLKEPKLMKFGDLLMMIILWVETLELISIGPDMRAYSRIIFRPIALFSPDWSGPLDNTRDHFWIEIYIVISLISFMVCSAIIIQKRLSKKYSHHLFELAELVSEIGVILLCSIAYIPLSSILLSVFLCKESTGDSITDSFVCNDCYTYCWSGFHFSISLLCFAVLIMYLSLVIYFQPSWQLFHPIFNVVINPKTAVYKSAAYFIMIGINKNIHLVSEALQGLVYSIALLALAFIYWKIRIYNYPRMNMWAIFSLLAVIWSNLVFSIHSILDRGNNVFWEFGLAAGWGILVVAGMILQNFKFPSLLMTDKGIELGVLFKFSMGSKVCAVEINELKKQPKFHRHMQKHISYAEDQNLINSKISSERVEINSQNNSIPPKCWEVPN
ncbi:unnamed protein product [Blepharisma stoltei]|uniref:Receptor ligand binding region domain-containing protein n=1 Tax=Blepharisma stoltei TaxID=1481888 RepID=A0AAU9JFR2_9CILI|nr:unnamed protein product [Blepharisma stoltei]